MKPQATDELVRRIASLARLALEPAEVEAMRSHFENVLRFVEELEAVDLSAADGTPLDAALLAAGAADSLRPDEVAPSLSVASALANAPRHEGSSFVVPRIVGDADAGGSIP
jgi:aspartyl-tRNA(Asn)/glutamyl-tRNA(Gln) amidotransferase subunit C